MKTAIRLAAAWAGLAAAALGQPRRIVGTVFRRPLEVTAHQADAILIARITSMGEPRQITVTLPGAPEPITRQYAKAKATIDRVIKPSSDKAHALAKGGAIEFEVLARTSSQGTRPQPIIRKGPAYLLALQRFDDSHRWFLPFSHAHFQSPARVNVEKIARAADTSGWPWGPAAGELQIAMISKWSLWKHTAANKDTVFFRAFLAVRNVSKEPVTVNLRPADAPLWVEARAVNGQTVRADVYDDLHSKLKGEWPKPVETLGPGEACFVCTTGAKPVQVGGPMDLAAGAWSLFAGYQNQRGETEDGRKLWTGKVLSMPLRVTVTNR